MAMGRSNSDFTYPEWNFFQYEHPHAAASVGINVRRIRYIAVLASGFLAGLAGGCLVLIQTIQYTSSTINGAGFIALATVSFGR